LQQQDRDAPPVEPAGEGIARRKAVEQHEGASRRRAAQPAERHDRLAGARDEKRLEVARVEAGHAAQQVGDRLRRGGGELRRVDEDDVRRQRLERLLGARRGDDDRVERRRCRLRGVGTLLRGEGDRSGGEPRDGEQARGDAA
jgi:hypothetical protein